MQGGIRRVLPYGVALALALSVLYPDRTAQQTTLGSNAAGAPEEFFDQGLWEKRVRTRKEPRQSAAAEGQAATAQEGETKPAEVHKARRKRSKRHERGSIQAIDIPFKNPTGDPSQASAGIFLSALGEPKSGTTWLSRVIVELCVQICGNSENTWCKMGGLKVRKHVPAFVYDFEMLHADTDELFLHFKGDDKHVIPGLGMEECSGEMNVHPNSFGLEPPCEGRGDLSRGNLVACLPGVTPTCARQLRPSDPPRRRMVVIFRDARNLVISEHRMRRGVMRQNVTGLEPYILSRFETVVAWIHQRFVWHISALEESTHVIFYEDIQTHPHQLTSLAAFLGLNCTSAKAEDILQRHENINPPGDYTTYGVSTETLEWMNATMSKTLPEAMLARYGLIPTWE